MAITPIKKVKWNKCSFRGLNTIYSGSRINHKEVPEYVNVYDCRHGDNNFTIPVTIEDKVRVNHAGTILSYHKINLGNEGFLELTKEEGVEFNNSYEKQSILEYALENAKKNLIQLNHTIEII